MIRYIVCRVLLEFLYMCGAVSPWNYHENLLKLQVLKNGGRVKVVKLE